MLTVLSLSLALGSQSIDTHEEAWSIAARQGITPNTWTEIHADRNAAIFVRNAPVGSEYWIALIDAEDLTVTLRLSSIKCEREVWTFSQGLVRDWSGHTLRTLQPEAVLIAPGSIGERVLSQFCVRLTSSDGVPIVLPVEPFRQQSDGSPVIMSGPTEPR